MLLQLLLATLAAPKQLEHEFTKIDRGGPHFWNRELGLSTANDLMHQVGPVPPPVPRDRILF